MELWKLMHPAAGIVRGLRRSPVDRVRHWLRFRRGEFPWFAQV